MKAYAKLNIYLRIINKREDGYHNLQMVNTKIDIYDIIYISNTNDKDQIVYLNDPNGDTSDNNLILKTLKAFKGIYNIKNKYLIEIEKHIPYGAGLGGASMDVGTVIDYINQKENLNLTKDELITFTKQFGADIPYSFYDEPCIVEGIGDIITPIDYPSKQLILVIPNIYINTKDIFENNNIYNKEITHEELKETINQNIYINDLQITTTKLNNELNELDIYLKQFGQSFMTGSGSCFVLDTSLNIDDVTKQIESRFPQYKVKIIKTKEGKENGKKKI